MSITQPCSNSPKSKAPVAVPSNFAMIIGAMKAGTTSLYRGIVCHPEVSACHTKEPYFWSSDEATLGDIDAYRGLWDWNSHQHRVALEASTSYTKLPVMPDVAARLGRIKGARFRFIYLMRHPIDRINSHLQHVAGDFDGSMDEIKRRVLPEAIAFSRYAIQLDSYRQHFGGSSILPLLFEDFRDDPSKSMKTVFEFLELSPMNLPASVAEKHNSGDYWRSRVQSPMFRYLKNHSFCRQIKKFVPPETRRRLNRYNINRSIRALRLTRKERESVLDELGPDLRRLHSEYDVNVDRWAVPTMGKSLF